MKRSTDKKNVFILRRYWRNHRYKTKRIHKSWVGVDAGLKAVLTDLFVVFQISCLLVAYALLVAAVPYAFLAACVLTVLTMIYVAIEERDVQSKISWITLMFLSFGSGFLIYILASKTVCYGLKRSRFAKICERLPAPQPSAEPEVLSEAAISDGDGEGVFEYLENNGFCAYAHTDGKYYANARNVLDNVIACVGSAQKFVFIEFFIVADGVYLERLIAEFKRKTAEGVEIYMLCDDVGCAGVLSDYAKKRIKAAGVHFAVFRKLFSPFNFGLNFRDHRKIVVVDGKYGYTGGFNFIDDCANERKMEGVWKDSGIKITGEAVDRLSNIFMRQWEFAVKEKLDQRKYLGLYESTENSARYAPYAGGPEIIEPVCRNVYMRLIDSAQKRLYIMTPYLVPDSGIMRRLKERAREGIDVRIVLPGVPDYRYIYRVTTANARRLMKAGVKVCYSGGEFVHAKVMLSDGIAAVGSVNLDMRAFYQELDNGLVTDDEIVIAAVEDDFNLIIGRNGYAGKFKNNPFNIVVTALLKLVSPLM